MNKKTEYAIGRKNTNTQDFEVITVNQPALTVYRSQSFDRANKYEDLDHTCEIVKLLNMMSTLLSDPYEYQVIQRDTNFTLRDSDGNEIESEVPLGIEE